VRNFSIVARGAAGAAGEHQFELSSRERSSFGAIVLGPAEEVEPDRRNAARLGGTPPVEHHVMLSGSSLGRKHIFRADIAENGRLHALA